MTKTPLEYFNRWPKYFGPKAGAIDILIRYKNGEDDWRPSNGCCGHMRSIPVPQNIESVYASLWCREESLYETACDYWDYLLGKDSPFRLALKDLERLYDDKGRPIAFGLHDMTAPLQVCMSVMIQCRIPQEQVSKLRSYKHWRDSGFTQVQAFYLSEHFLMMPNGELQPVAANAYHHGFEVHGNVIPGGGINFKMLKNGTPKYAALSWSAGDSRYDQLGRHYLMWSEPKESPVFALVKAPQKYSGKFGEAFKKLVSADLLLKTDGVCNPTTASKILKENLSQWATND